MSTILAQRCKYMVPQRPHYLRRYHCSRKAVKNGYCTQHAKKMEKKL